MKFKIVVEDKKKGKIEIPLSKRRLCKLFDIMYMIGGSDAIETIKLNKDLDTFRWFHKITDHMVFDILEGGIFMEGNKATKKFKAVRRGFHYLTKKPYWRKGNKSIRKIALIKGEAQVMLMNEVN